MWLGILLIIIGVAWVTHQWGIVLPSILIALGVSMVVRRPRRWYWWVGRHNGYRMRPGRGNGHPEDEGVNTTFHLN